MNELRRRWKLARKDIEHELRKGSFVQQDVAVDPYVLERTLELAEAELDRQETPSRPLWSVISYVADVFILGTYLLIAVAGWPVWWFHLANAIGCVPLLVVEYRQRAYPVMPLTGAFGVIGWLGLLGVSV